MRGRTTDRGRYSVTSISKREVARTIRGVVNEALAAALAGDFSALDSRPGRPSIPPGKLLRAMLLQASIRSARSGR